MGKKMIHDMVSAWILFFRLVQCIALVFFFYTLDWQAVEKCGLKWVGIL